MKKTLGFCAALIFVVMAVSVVSCDNMFLKKKIDDINPVPMKPPFYWDVDSVLLDPIAKESFYPSVVSGLLSSGSYKFWLREMSGEDYLEIELDSSEILSDELPITALVTSDNPNLITLSFRGVDAPAVSPNIVRSLHKGLLPNVVRSAIGLLPSFQDEDEEEVEEENDEPTAEEIIVVGLASGAFRGADSNLFDTSQAETTITFRLPTISEYAVRRIEGEELDLGVGGTFTAWPDDDDAIKAAVIAKVLAIKWLADSGDPISDVTECDISESEAVWVEEPTEGDEEPVKYVFEITNIGPQKMSAFVSVPLIIPEVTPSDGEEEEEEPEEEEAP